jgi:ribose 5-phosphate isomerase B
VLVLTIGIRAAICNDPIIAKVARAHNNANVLVIPAGFVKPGKKLHSIIDVFLTTKFEGGRHLRRLNIIKTYENSHVQNP